MINFDNYSLELSKKVNNIKLEKLIFDVEHIINKEDMIASLKNYNFNMENYVGFDLDSLNNYENWLGENFGRD